MIAQRWWRTVSDEGTQVQGQASLDRVCAKLDSRKRTRDGVATTVGALADAEGLRPAPAAFAAMLDVTRMVSDQALVSFRGNRYSVGPGHAAEIVHVRHRLGTTTSDVLTARGVTLARHLRQPDGAGTLVRATEHVAALERIVLANFADKPVVSERRRQP